MRQHLGRSHSCTPRVEKQRHRLAVMAFFFGTPIVASSSARSDPSEMGITYGITRYNNIVCCLYIIWLVESCRHVLILETTYRIPKIGMDTCRILVGVSVSLYISPQCQWPCGCGIALIMAWSCHAELILFLSSSSCWLQGPQPLQSSPGRAVALASSVSSAWWNRGQTSNDCGI